MYLDARPLLYLFIRKVNSPGVFDREMGVYGRITGFPFASLSPSGLEDLTMTQEATGSKEASLSPNLNTNLVAQSRQGWNPSEGTRCSLGSVVVVVFDPLELKVDKVSGVKWAGLF